MRVSVTGIADEFIRFDSIYRAEVQDKIHARARLWLVEGHSEGLGGEGFLAFDWYIRFD